METWVIEIAKILAGAIAGILLAEFVPGIKSFFKRSSLSIRNNSIKYIKQQYKSIRAYKANHATLAVEILRRLFNRFVLAVIFITLAITGIYTKIEGRETWLVNNIGIIMGIFLGTLYQDFREIESLVGKVVDFEGYKTKVIKDLGKLGAILDEE